jgi:hypothetical protein
VYSNSQANQQKEEFQIWLEHASMLNCYGNASICLIAPKELNAKSLVLQVLGEGGSKVLEWHSQYR